MSPRTITRLPVETGRSGWEAICERPFPARELDANLKADWIVIGAGFGGLAAARRITQVRPGDKVVVLDALQIAEGPAGRNSGYMIDVPHNLSAGEYSAAGAEATALEIAQNRFAINFAADAAAEYRMDREIFDPSGKINAASTERGMGFNQRYAASLSRIGETNTLLDAKTMQELTGSRYYLGGLQTPGAVMIQPAEYIRAFAAGVAHKVQLFENSPVTQLERQAGIWTARTPRGRSAHPR